MKTLLLSLMLFPLFYVFSHRNISSDESINIPLQIDKGKEALEFCKKNNYNTDFCILIDMRIHSGKERFFVWSLANDSILDSGLCSHGCCENPWGEDETKTAPVFSNTPNSHCSSIGKYKIGKRGYSQWGINVNYKLHGLETTNKNAYGRYIVLHSWEMVPNGNTYPIGVPEGWGCPAVSNSMMKNLDKRLKTTTKPVLLWVFN